MRLFTISSLVILISALSACKQPEPELASSSAFASTEPPPPFIIAKESRDQLQKTKEITDTLEKAALEKQKTIENISKEKN